MTGSGSGDGVHVSPPSVVRQSVNAPRSVPESPTTNPFAGSGKRTARTSVAATLAPLGARAETYAELARLIDAIARAARPGDHVLIMSNGGFGGIHGKLLARLRESA